MLRIDTPEWEPLLDLAPDHVDEFMWMFAVELDDDARIQAYKHYWTREYLYLDGEGRAYLHFDGSRYEGEEPGWLLSRALGEDTPTRDWYHFVEQNDPEEIEISWARSATKHRISRARSERVVRRCGLRFAHRSHDGPLGFDEPRLLLLGDDEAGVPLEVIAVEVGEGELHVIHAMQVRNKHLGLYERVKRWQR